MSDNGIFSFGTDDRFSKENVDKSFYNVVFPKHKFQGSFDMFQKATRFSKDARVTNQDEDRLLRLERSVGSAMALENQGRSKYAIGLNYYTSKNLLGDSGKVTRDQAMQGYQDYLADKETYGGYLDKTSLQMYEMSGMYGDDLKMDDYVQYQSMEKKMVERNTWEKIGDALTVNYAMLSPESKKWYLDQEGKGFWDKADELETYNQLWANSALSNTLTSVWMGTKVGGFWGGVVGAGAGLAGAIQEVVTGDENWNKEIARGFYGGLGQTASIIGSSMMELDYRLGFKGLVDKMDNLNVEDGLTEDNMKQSYDAQQEYLHDISPVGFLGDLMYNFGNSISMAGRGKTQALYEGGFQKNWFNWGLSYIPSTIGQIYGTVVLSKGLGALGLGAKAGGVATANTSKLMQIVNGTGKYLAGTGVMNFMFSASEAWNTRENMVASGNYNEQQVDDEATETLWKNVGLMGITGAVPGQYSKLGRLLFGGNRAVTYGLAGLDAILEGIEEVSQDYIQSSAMDEEYKLASEQAVSTFALGMIGGMFGGINTIANDKVNHSFVKVMEGYNQTFQSAEITNIINEMNAGKIDSEDASVKILEEMRKYGDEGELVAQRAFTEVASKSIVTDIVDGIKTVYNQVGDVKQKAQQKKQFIKNDLDLKGLGAKVDNGVYTIELVDKINNFQDEYAVIDTVAKDIALSEYGDIVTHDTTNNKLHFTDVPVGFAKKVKEETARRMDVKKKIDGNVLENNKDNRKRVDKLFESEILEEGEYARVLRKTFGENKTGNKMIDTKVAQSDKIKQGNVALNSAVIELNDKTLSALEKVSKEIEDGNHMGYETREAMDEQLVDKKYIDKSDINTYEDIPNKYQELKAKLEEQKRVDAGEKVQALQDLMGTLDETTKQYEEKLANDKKLRKQIKKERQLKKVDEVPGVGHSISLEELDMYESVANEDGTPKAVVLEKKPAKKVEVKEQETGMSEEDMLSELEEQEEFPDGEYNLGDLYTSESFKATKKRETKNFVIFEGDNQGYVDEFKYSKITQQFVGLNDHYTILEKPQSVSIIPETKGQVKADKVPNVETIGTNSKEQELFNYRNANEFDTIAKGINKILRLKVMDLSDKKIFNSKEANLSLNMLDTNRFKYNNKSVKDKTETLAQVFSEEISNILIGDDRLSRDGILDEELDKVTGQDGDSHNNMVEAFDYYLDNPNFKGIVMVHRNKETHDRILEKYGEYKQLPDVIEKRNTIFNMNEDPETIKEILGDMREDTAFAYMNEHNLNRPESPIDMDTALERYDKMYEHTYVSKADYLNAFKQMFAEEYQGVVQEVLDAHEKGVQEYEEKQIKEICK